MGTPGCQVYKVGKGSEGLFLHDSLRCNVMPSA